MPERRYARSAPIRTEAPPWTLAPRAVAAAFGGASEAVVVRSVVLRVAEEIRVGREPPVRGNLRTLGYRYLVPVWSHLPGVRLDGWYARLVRETRRLVTDWRALRYADLGITDVAWEGRRIGARFPEVVVFAEDVDFVRLFRDVTERFGVTTVAFAGSPSAVTLEFTASHVGAAMARLGRAGPLHLLALTDWDPSGYDNARTVQTRLADFGLGRSQLHLVMRPELLPARTLARVAVPITRKGAMARVLARWLAETGGIGGEARKLEATSVPEATLMRAVERTLGELGYPVGTARGVQ